MPNTLLEREGDLGDSQIAAIEKKVRVQLDFDPTDMLIINDLVSELDLGTRAELFRSGLRALRWMVQKRQQGCTVVAITEAGMYLEPEFDFLQRLSPSSLPKEGTFRSKAFQSKAVPEPLTEAAHV